MLKIIEWACRALGGLFLIMAGWMLKEWELAGSPDILSMIYWRVWIFLGVAAYGFTAAYFIGKDRKIT